MSRWTSVLAVSLLGVAAGCTRDDIVSYKIPKEPALELPAGFASAPAAALPTPASDLPAPASGGDLHWDVPSGWTAQPASGMRFASFQTPASGGKGAEVSVVVLPGSAGGNLPNINRWRGQIGLAPLDDAGLGADTKKVASRAGNLLTVDFKGTSEGSPSRLVAGILSAGEKTWFFKMTGSEKAVEQAKPSFLAFLKSLKPAGS